MSYYCSSSTPTPACLASAEPLGDPSAFEERQRQAAARLRAAFSGGVGEGADVLSLAAQLSAAGGSQLADQLVSEPVDPMVFLAEATELLDRVQEQLGQLEEFVEQQQRRRQQQGGGRGGGVASAQEEQAVLLLQQRQGAAALVEQCVQLAQVVAQQYGVM